jgi:O-antigen ligase
MFQTLSRFFIYASLTTPLLLIKHSFFPFISWKATIFRIVVELSLLFFALHLFSVRKDTAYLKAIAKKLKHPLVICIGIFALAFTVAALIGINPTQSFWSSFERSEGAFQILHYAVFAVLAILLFTDRKDLERLMKVHIVVSIPICFYALLQLLISTSDYVIAPGARVSGTLGNPSYLAAYLIFTFAFIAYFFLRTKDSFYRIALGTLALFEGFIFLKTGTRGAFLGLIAALLVFAVIHYFRTENRKTRTVLASIFIGTIVLISIFFSTRHATLWTQVPVLNRLINFTSAITDIQPRIWTWGSAMAGFIERPVAGWGAENFPVPFDKYYNPNHYGLESFFDRTHNIFLEYLISGGLLVLIPWLGILFFYYRELLRRPKDLWHSILFVVPIAYLVQGFFLFDTLPIYIGFFVLITLLLNTAPDEQPLGVPEEEIDERVMIAGVGIIIVFAALIHTTALRPLTKNRLLLNALILQNTFTTQVANNQPTSVTPNDILISFRKALNYPSVIGQEEAVGMYQKYILQLVEMTTQNERIMANPATKGEVLGVVDEANKIFEAHRSLYPGIKQQYLNGGINLRAGFSFQSERHLNRGKELFLNGLSKAPTRLEFIRVLIELARLQGDQKELETWMRRANLYRPDLFKLETAPAKTAQ